jgi:hypothetical protein
MSDVVLRPVHVYRLGRWRLNWRVGRYPWFLYDRVPAALTVVLRFFYVSVARLPLDTGDTK